MQILRQFICFCFIKYIKKSEYFFDKTIYLTEPLLDSDRMAAIISIDF